MDATTEAIIEALTSTGYSVMSGADSVGNSVAEATDEATGERFIVRADDLYATV